MTLPDCITIEEPTPGYPVFVINHPTATARVALHGAHVMEWQPAGQAQPVLYMSPDALLEQGKPIRGGIPICWPWFGGHPTDAAKPMHGFARIRPWELVRADAQEGHVAMLFKLESSEETRALWPHDFRCHLGVSIGAALEVSLMSENTGETPFHLTEALHTYLTVGDIEQVTVRGLTEASYLDTVGERTMREQEGDITFDREVDRQYTSSAGVIVEDRSLGRNLVVNKLGSGTTVVWNPWIEKSKRLADLPDEAYHGFLCVEAANAGDAAVTVMPGGRHVLLTQVSMPTVV
ncbi:MAG: D-hexose-6-phosphate mutarotase [Prosthecobacter sp.]